MKKMPAGKFKAQCLPVMKEVRATREPVLITKRGRPVAKLVPLSGGRRFVPRSEIQELIARSPLDLGFVGDVASALGSTIDEL